MSFHDFLAVNYELSHCVLPKTHPSNDMLDKQEMLLLIDLMNEKDFYEINRIIKNRYKQN